ncbi:MAG: matrixin family metalloprotease, partial [Deltaproteobacteria bacterium]|nr:matrixin family metalloprotease [Deltaproteobacteria bacterium]
FGPNVAGLTTVNWAGSEIEGAVVMINNTIPLCSGDCVSGLATSQRKAFAHELGHFLGLQHGSDVNDIMYPTLQPGGKLDTVSVDLTTLMELTSDVAQ